MTRNRGTARGASRLVAAGAAISVILLGFTLGPPTASARYGGRGQAPGAAGAGGAAPAGLKTYQSPYYVIHTDLGEEEVKEANVRMSRMAEEYYERTKGFSGVIRNKFPFYLFRNEADYHAAGGPPGSAGVFSVRGSDARLMAIAGEKITPTTWQVVQHEGFHQFAHAVIGGDIPMWANEGLAEYFGESIFTGDGFTTGVIPPDRLKRIKDGIEKRRFKSVKDMMLTTRDQWNDALEIENYDQAWSMTHFLAHGDEGKYQAAFANFMRDIGRGRPWATAWENNFGSADGFEQKWSEWWLGLPDNPTRHLYARATVAILTSFAGRATVGQRAAFQDFDAFVRAAKNNELKINPNDWLPPSLLESALAAVDGGPAITLAADPLKNPQITLVLDDKTRIVGAYNARSRSRVTVETDDTALVVERARALIAENKKDKARALLVEALKNHPRSPYAEEIRKLLPETR